MKQTPAASKAKELAREAKYQLTLSRGRCFPKYVPGMSTYEYVSRFQILNSGNRSLWPLFRTRAELYALSTAPAAQYDATVPLCLEEHDDA